MRAAGQPSIKLPLGHRDAGAGIGHSEYLIDPVNKRVFPLGFPNRA